MSNEKNLPDLFRSQLPAFLQGITPEQVMQLNAEAANGARGGSNINRISLKQSRFRLIVGGEETAVLPASHLDLVVLRVSPVATKTWFAKSWTPGQDAEQPDCFSNDGARPHSDAKNPQCDSCATCPHNEWGSKINPLTQAKAKACVDNKRLAVLPRNKLADGDVFQLTVPPASLADWGAYTTMLSQVSPPVPYNALVTRVAFDTDAEYPKIKFAPAGWLTAEEYAIVQERFDEDDIREAASVDNGAVAPRVVNPAQRPAVAQQAQPVQQAQQAQPVQQAQQAQPVQQAQTTVDASGWGVEPAAQAAAPAAQAAPARARRSRAAAPAQQAAPAPQAQPAADDSGWGAAPAVQTAPVQQAAPQAQTFDNSGTGAVADVPAGGDAGLDSVFGQGWNV